MVDEICQVRPMCFKLNAAPSYLLALKLRTEVGNESP